MSIISWLYHFARFISTGDWRYVIILSHLLDKTAFVIKFEHTNWVRVITHLDDRSQSHDSWLPYLSVTFTGKKYNAKAIPFFCVELISNNLQVLVVANISPWLSLIGGMALSICITPIAFPTPLYFLGTQNMVILELQKNHKLLRTLRYMQNCTGPRALYERGNKPNPHQP